MRPLMRRSAAIVFAIAGLLALPWVQAGKVYRWVDADGVAHYGDRMPASATAKPARAIAVE